MAKRKRLTPAQPGYLEGQRAPETKSMPTGSPGSVPIAQVAGDASARAALEELSSVLQTAREDGRIIELVPLAEVDESHLVRDRMEQDEDELGALIDSLRARGQQTAVEVIRLPDPGNGFAYGLISGWRRLTALRRLYSETGEDRFASIRARITAPETAQDAYVAMVEENEIRVNLSFYERARIAVRALREGVYPSQRAALRGLFGTTTRSRRSKIGSFIAVVEAFDGDLKHPTAISEKLGLALAREILRDPGFVAKVRAGLKSNPERNTGEEMRLLVTLVEAQYAPAPDAPLEAADVAPDPGSKPAPGKDGSGVAPKTKADRRAAAPTRSGVREYVAPGVSLSFFEARGKIELTGPNVDAALSQALKAWFAAR